jgi:Domain of unknown function (DUF5658)
MMSRVHTVAGSAALLAMLFCAAPACAQSEQATGADLSAGRSSRLRFLLGTEAVLHSVDMVTTVRNLQLDGTREANPLLAPFSERPAALVAISSAVNVLQLYTISKLHRRHPKLAVAWALILIGTEAYVVTNNVRVLGQLRAARGDR